MAAAIHIPADLTIVTVSTGGSNQPQRWTPDYARSVLDKASGLLKDCARIQFYLNSCEAAVEELPGETRSGAVDDAGYYFLAARHPAGAGARVLLVDRVARPDLGSGEARYRTRVCLIAFGVNPAPTGRLLAHELGHLLELRDLDRVDRPGHEKHNAFVGRNLMYEAPMNPIAELTSARWGRPVARLWRAALAGRKTCV